jgi:leader peptidase (prepilin peptidase)/N-methyltransferase
MTPLIVTLAIAGGLVGLVFGSFLNVVIWRVPRGLSVVRPASACPGCHAEIRAVDNIPVVSWLALRGRCHSCRTPISMQYPLVELLTGMVFALVVAWFAPVLIGATGTTEAVAAVLELTALLVLAACSIALAVIDMQVRRLPNAIVLFLALSGVVLFGTAGLLTGNWEALARAGIGGAAAYALFFAVAFIKPDGMGFGDVKLAGALGIFLGYAGWSSLIVGFFSAFLLGGIAGIALIIARRANRRGSIPFGPWLVAGAWVGIMAGPFIAQQYLSFVGLT